MDNLKQEAQDARSSERYLQGLHSKQGEELDDMQSYLSKMQRQLETTLHQRDSLQARYKELADEVRTIHQSWQVSHFLLLHERLRSYASN